jgi:hypothetical protein
VNAAGFPLLDTYIPHMDDILFVCHRNDNKITMKNNMAVKLFEVTVYELQYSAMWRVMRHPRGVLWIALILQ